MKVDAVESVLAAFLASDTCEVLALRGAWGVGKTFLWNRFIRKASRDAKYKFEPYAYISLFGINSLDTLKQTIFEQIVSRSAVGKNADLASLKESTEQVVSSLSRRLVGMNVSLPYVGSVRSFLQSAAFLSVHDVLVCFDDFERKGDALSAKDIMGLVTLLKEQRQCKVIIIFDDSNLNAEAQDDYARLREKVIDTEVTFSPTAEEAAVLAYGSDLSYESHLKNLSVKLDIRNLRILRKIRRAAQQILPLLVNFEPELSERALASLVLYVWCNYSRDSNVPPLQYIRDVSRRHYRKKEVQPSAQEQTWDSVLTSYGYHSTDEFDHALIEAIESGVIDEAALDAGARRANAQIVIGKSHASYAKAWEMYFGSFEPNEVDLVRELDASIRANAKFISLPNLDPALRLLRDLNQSALASNLIDVYIAANKDQPQILDLEESAFARDIGDSELISKANTAFSELSGVPTLASAVASIADRGGWTPADEQTLRYASVEDYYNLFKATRGEALGRYITACLNLRGPSPQSEGQGAVKAKVREALLRIGSESPLNASRVARFGVIVDSHTQAESQ